MKICVIAPTVIPILGAKQRYGGIELVIALAVEELIAGIYKFTNQIIHLPQPIITFLSIDL